MIKGTQIYQKTQAQTLLAQVTDFYSSIFWHFWHFLQCFWFLSDAHSQKWKMIRNKKLRHDKRNTEIQKNPGTNMSSSSYRVLLINFSTFLTFFAMFWIFGWPTQLEMGNDIKQKVAPRWEKHTHIKKSEYGHVKLKLQIFSHFASKKKKGSSRCGG